MKKLILWAGGIFLVMMLFASIGANTPANAKEKAARDTPVGYNGHLNVAPKTAPLSRDKEAQAELRKVELANDAMGFADLQLQNKVITVPGDSAVLVIDKDVSLGGSFLKVRITSKTYLGYAGWVQATWVGP